MKICFVGLGSIGSRHLKNLTEILKERNIIYNIDALRSKKSMLPGEISSRINNIFYDFEDLPCDYDIIFITNPTIYHYEAISKIVSKTKHIFIEKPVFDSCGYDISKLRLKPNGIYYVACPLRYSPVLKFIENVVKEENIYSVRAISSSYLPDWRKGVDYRNIYSAIKSQGGGVTLDLIHEWDYITHLFGAPVRVFNLSGKYSDLEINSDDLSVYIAEYSDKLIEIHLDYLGRNLVRQLELYCKDYVIYADFLQMKIDYRGTVNRTVVLDKEDMYRNEMNCFIDMILEHRNNNNNIYHAYNTLKIATGERFQGFDIMEDNI